MMGVLDEMRSLERQQFFDGQRLFATDMQGLEAFHREMRWLHNESLHQPGIGNGFAVTGNKGDREVTVYPGYALDFKGREIVLIVEEKLQVPPVAAERDGSPVFFDLTVAYPDDAALEEVETQAGVCRDRGTVRLSEKPVFCWVRLRQTEAGTLVAADARLGAEVEGGVRLVVGRVEVLNCRLNKDISLAQRRDARPSPQPKIACGNANPDWQLAWFTDRAVMREFLRELIIDPFVREGGDHLSAGDVLVTLLSMGLDKGNPLAAFPLPFGLRTTVMTTQASFQTMPCYTVRLDGSRVIALGLKENDDIDII